MPFTGERTVSASIRCCRPWTRSDCALRASCAGAQIEQDALALETCILVRVLVVEARDGVGVVGGLVVLLADDVHGPCRLQALQLAQLLAHGDRG